MDKTNRSLVRVHGVCGDGYSDADDTKEEVDTRPPDEIGKGVVDGGNDGADECNQPRKLKHNVRRLK